MLFYEKIVLIIILLFGTQLKAQLISDWDLNLGSSTFTYSLGSEVKNSFETNSHMEISYNLIHRGIHSALNISFSEVLNGDGVSLPYTRFAMGGRYYFLGLNGERTIYDTGAQVQSYKATPFIGINLGLSNLSVPGLNATFIDYAFRGGVEIPLTAQVLLVGQIGISSDLLSSSATADNRVQYSTFDLFAGFRILPKF